MSAIREPLVPLALAQGPERVAVLLAILKLGGAYVPIEPSYPATRIRQILDDIDASFVITESALADGVVAAADRGPRLLEVLQVDVEHRHIARQEPGPMAPEIGADSACYVMYTSGSTGRPKGIVIPHRGVVRPCVDVDYMDVRPEHCFGQLANIAFDAATWEIWGALLNGAQVALLEPETALATSALGHAIREHRITHVFLTTALRPRIRRSHRQSGQAPRVPDRARGDRAGARRSPRDRRRRRDHRGGLRRPQASGRHPRAQPHRSDPAADGARAP